MGAVGVVSGLPPIATVGADIPVRQLRANNGLMHCSKTLLFSASL